MLGLTGSITKHYAFCVPTRSTELLSLVSRSRSRVESHRFASCCLSRQTEACLDNLKLNTVLANSALADSVKTWIVYDFCLSCLNLVSTSTTSKLLESIHLCTPSDLPHLDYM